MDIPYMKNILILIPTDNCPDIVSGEDPRLLRVVTSVVVNYIHKRYNADNSIDAATIITDGIPKHLYPEVYALYNNGRFYDTLYTTKLEKPELLEQSVYFNRSIELIESILVAYSKHILNIITMFEKQLHISDVVCIGTTTDSVKLIITGSEIPSE